MMNLPVDLMYNNRTGIGNQRLLAEAEQLYRIFRTHCNELTPANLERVFPIKFVKITLWRNRKPVFETRPMFGPQIIYYTEKIELVFQRYFRVY